MRIIMEKKVFKNYLQKKGLRYTKEREEIIEGILSIDGHFDSEELLLHLRKINSKTSLASVYRTLPLLIEAGLITEVIKTGKNTRYEVTYGRKHHDHMICINCGKVIEFSSDKIEKLQEEIAREYGFNTNDHCLELRGYCKKCAS